MSDTPNPAPQAPESPEANQATSFQQQLPSDNHWPAPEFKQPRARPVLGPALWMFGALLWAYVVLGELVVKVNFPEPLAVLLVLGIAGATFHVAVWQQIPAGNRNVERLVIPALVAFGFWVGLLFFVSLLLGSERRSAIAILTWFLWFVAAVAGWFGRRLTTGARPLQNPFNRGLTVVLYLICGVTTVIALLFAASDF